VKRDTAMPDVARAKSGCARGRALMACMGEDSMSSGQYLPCRDCQAFAGSTAWGLRLVVGVTKGAGGGKNRLKGYFQRPGKLRVFGGAVREVQGTRV
jgi:hypothetical protein